MRDIDRQGRSVCGNVQNTGRLGCGEGTRREDRQKQTGQKVPARTKRTRATHAASARLWRGRPWLGSARVRRRARRRRRRTRRTRAPAWRVSARPPPPGPPSAWCAAPPRPPRRGHASPCAAPRCNRSASAAPPRSGRTRRRRCAAPPPPRRSPATCAMPCPSAGRSKPCRTATCARQESYTRGPRPGAGWARAAHWRYGSCRLCEEPSQ